jgi:hypothetical protein
MMGLVICSVILRPPHPLNPHQPPMMVSVTCLATRPRLTRQCQPSQHQPLMICLENPQPKPLLRKRHPLLTIFSVPPLPNLRRLQNLLPP